MTNHFILRFMTPFLLVFAKQNGKMHFKMQLLFYNKVVFTRKYVPL